MRVPRAAAFDNPLSGTELREARGASRGNACLDSKNVVSLSLRFGLQSTGFFSLVRVKPRHQNVQQDGASSGAHSITRQLVCRTGFVSCQTFPEAEASEARFYDVLLRLISDVLSPGNELSSAVLRGSGSANARGAFGVSSTVQRDFRRPEPVDALCRSVTSPARPVAFATGFLRWLQFHSWNAQPPNQILCPFARPIALGFGDCCFR